MLDSLRKYGDFLKQHRAHHEGVGEDA